MAWVVCPRCHFSQIPGERCRRCGETLEPASPNAAPAGPSPEEPASPAVSKGLLAVAAAVLLFAVIWMGRRGNETAAAVPAPEPVPTVASIDLSGRWHATVSKTIGGNPPRPVLKEVSIESDREGAIRASRLVFTDPGRGGAGAGYQMVSDASRRLSEAAAALASAPAGATLSVDFLALPGWVPERPRLWKALEGAARGGEASSYLLMESLETDYLIQAGINESGFLSYAFFSPAYAPTRGQDELSRVIHPEPGASLRGFRDLLWDLSGAANFMTLELPVTVSGPEGGTPDDLVLKR